MGSREAVMRCEWVATAGHAMRSAVLLQTRHLPGNGRMVSVALHGHSAELVEALSRIAEVGL